MSMVVACPGCGQKYSAGPELAGKKIRCRNCGGGVRVPESVLATPKPSVLKPAASRPTPPPPPPSLDDDLDAYGLAEEPEVTRAPEEELFTPEGPPRRVKAKGKKSKKGRGGIGGWIDSAREKPAVAGGVGAVLLAMALFLAIKPVVAAPLYLILGMVAAVVGGVWMAILVFAQAPLISIAFLVGLALTIGAMVMMGGAAAAQGGRLSKPWPVVLIGVGWGLLVRRGRRMDIHLDGDAFRIPKRLMGGGALLVLTSLIVVLLFPPPGMGARRMPRRGAMPPFGGPQRDFLRQIAPPPANLGADGLPDLPAGRRLEAGVMFHEVRLGPPWMSLRAPGTSGRLWVYLPEGDAPAKSLPCVVIAGAGTPMMIGMKLGQGDQPEHIPWVKAGFAVVAYDIDGDTPIPLDQGTLVGLIRPAIEGFLKARAGVANAQKALEFIAAKLPQVDPSRIIAVGHSSAGTLALLAAENDARFRGVAAFAPGQYSSAHADEIRRLERGVPGISELLTTLNPATPENLAKLNVPVFLFTAEDDGNVPAAMTRELADKLRSLGKQVTLETVPTGDHYDAMIGPGIAKAIAWAKGLPGNG